jgi:flagellar biogenesis protein FliO
METAYLAPRRAVSLVRVADKSVLIGITERNISILTELDEEKTAAIARAGETAAGKNGFAELLQSATRRVRELGLKKRSAVLENR